MPQIIIIILILIARLAAEGLNESSKRSSGSYRKTYQSDIKLRKDTASRNKYVSDRPTIDQAIASQTSGSYPQRQEPNKPSDDYDDFENYDTDDYETYTQDECYEESGHFVDDQMKTYNTYDMRANKIKFMIYTLVYCMWEDDDEITRKEKRMFKTISRAVSMNLNSQDTREVKTFIEKRIDLDDVVAKQREYHLDLVDVVNTISSLRKQLKKEKQYAEILKVIESRFQYEL